MSIQGSLEDVGVAEVLQFVHLGSSTGTLVLSRGDQRVEIGFHEGGIINAWDSQSLRLGELLISRGLVSREVVDCALALQATKPEPPPSIGEILIDEGLVELEEVRTAVVEQVRQAVSRAIEWSDGSFHFVKGPPRRRDQFDPDAVLGYKLNTQSLLLEIARTLDHARIGLSTSPSDAPREGLELVEHEPTANGGADPAARQAARPDAGASRLVADAVNATLETPSARVLAKYLGGVKPLPDAPSLTPEALEPHRRAFAPTPSPTPKPAERPSETPPRADRLVTPISATEAQAGVSGRTGQRPLVRVISDAPDFASELLAGVECEIEVLAFRDDWRSPQRKPLVLVVDMRPDRPLKDLAGITSASTGVEPVVLLPDVNLSASAYALGARAVIPDQPRALAGYVVAMLGAHRAAHSADPGVTSLEANGFARLREILADLRESSPSATRILGLMRVISDYAQRAAVFAVVGDQVRVIGAFGRNAARQPLADVLRRIGAFALSGALREAVERRLTVARRYDEEQLPRGLADALGPPANGLFQIAPISGGDKVILLVYLDNGERMQAIQGLDVIELAGAHIGLMFENDLLKSRFGAGGRERREASIS
ncbi:MAG TPA: DUF4388 domain-containing protein [Thermoanaerobaculia bacterium]|nr:DUF4388 domain-containing protein [Thermoanaerobaculia bacterium]